MLVFTDVLTEVPIGTDVAASDAGGVFVDVGSSGLAFIRLSGAMDDMAFLAKKSVRPACLTVRFLLEFWLAALASEALLADI